MKLTILLLTVALLQVCAASNAQSVTISGKDLTLRQVFDTVKKQTDYLLFANESDLAQTRRISLSVLNFPLKDLLDLIVKDQPVDYSIKGKTIVLSHRHSPPPREVSSPPVQMAALITGLVTDSLHKPVPGVSVSAISPKTNHYTFTVTDNKGQFEIIANKGDKLAFTAVGFAPFEMTLTDETTLSVILKVSVSQLNSVVIQSVNTGYQKLRPEQSTGAVSVITTKDYESRISTNFLDGLVNKLPGLMINNDVKFNSNINGTTSSNSLFNIRGISTMTANQSPLIVVDGYPTELSLNMVDPNEIKSVTILKDAAAATVYGVRASNGVIVIERKQASRGKPQIAFQATAGFTPKDNYTRYRWAPDASGITVDYLRDVNKTSINPSSYSQLSTYNYQYVQSAPYYILAQQAANLISPAQAEASFDALRNYNNAADYSRLFLRTAATQTYNLNMSGGSETALYYITANYTSNSLEQIRSGNNQLLLSGRSTLKFSPLFSLELTTDYQEEHRHAAPVPDINSLYPWERFRDTEGNPLPVISGSGVNPYYNQTLMHLGLYDELYYPLVDVNEVTDQTHTVNNRVTANFSYQLGGGFDLTFGGIYETARTDMRHDATTQSSEARQYINSYASQASDNSIVFNLPKGGFLQQQTANTSNYTARAQLNYNKRLGQDHSINGILGAELRDVTDQGYSTAYFGYNDQTLLQQAVNLANIANGTIQRNLSTTRTLSYPGLFKQLYTDDRYLSAYSNLVYTFRNTYSLSGSMRIDQSNLFGTDPKYKYKPLWSVSGAWNIHQEPFMQHMDWVKLLKLRVTDGFNGNVAKNSLPQVIAKALVNTITYPATSALQLFSYANSGLRWEQTHSLNIGLDYEFFHGINGSIDYYVKKSTALLANSFIDPTIGTSPSQINSASITNRGLELSLHADWITTPRFNWNTGLVLARNSSKVLRVYQNLGGGRLLSGHLK